MRLEDPSPARLETRVSPIVIRGGTSGAGLRARSSFFVPRPACRAFARLRATATTAGTWIQSARVVHTVPAVSTSRGTEGGAGARAAASSDAGGPPPRPPRCREPSGNDAGKGPCSCDLVLRASCRDAASDSRGPSGRVVPSALLRGPALVAKRRTCRPLPRPPARVVHASVSRILVDIGVDISAKGFRHL